MKKINLSKTAVVSVLSIASFFVGGSAFAGDLVCEYEGVRTTVPYVYADELVTEKVEVAPGVFAYTLECDGGVCDLIFEVWGQEEDTVFDEFNKIQKVEVPVPVAGGGTVVCEDTEVAKVKREVVRVQDQVDRAVKKAAKDVEKTAKKTGQDIEKAGRKVGRFVDSLFD